MYKMASIFKRGATMMKSSLIRISLIFILLVLFIPNFISAETKTFIKEYTYQASEADSKISSRVIALEQVKRLLLEELCTYLMSETRIKNYRVDKDEITAITAGTIRVIVIDENWNGQQYWLRAAVEADRDEVTKSVESIYMNYHVKVALEKSKEEREGLLKEIEQLKMTIRSVNGNDLTKSKAIYRDAVNRLSADDLFQNGYRLENAGDYYSAIDSYSKAIKLNPAASYYLRRAGSYSLLASEYRKKKRDNEAKKNSYRAIDDATKAIEINKKQRGQILLDYGFMLRAVAYNDLAGFYERPQEKGVNTTKNAKAKAKDYFQKALNDSDKAIKLSVVSSQQNQGTIAYLNRGIALDGLKQYKESIKALNKSLRLNRSKDKAVTTFAVLYLSGSYTSLLFGYNLDTPIKAYPSFIAESLIQERKYNEAIVKLDEAIGLDEEDAFSYNLRGTVYLNLEKYGQALKDIDNAIKIDTSFKKAYLQRSIIYCDVLNKCEKAIEDCNIAFPIDPTDNEFMALALYFRGGYYLKLGNKMQSFQDYDLAIDLNPTVSGYYLARAYVYMQLGQQKEFIEDLKIAAKLGDEKAQNALRTQKIKW